MSDAVAKALALSALAYKESHDKGDYDDIAHKPKLNGVQIVGAHDSAYYKLPLLAETGHYIDLDCDSEYNVTVKLLNKENTVISQSTIDLPIEGLIMDGHYKETSEGKWLVLTLQNGNEIEIPLDDLIDELATKEYVDSLYEDVINKLDSESQLRIQGDSELSARLDSEAILREQADNQLRLDLTSEGIIRLNEDVNLKNLLDSEALIRENQYNQLLTDLDSEAQTREAEDLILAFRIDSEGQIREQQFRAFRQALDDEIAARISGDSELRQDLNLEIFHRTQGDLDLRTALDSEATIRFNKDAELENAIGLEAQTRSSQDIALSNRINQKQDIITATSPIVKLGNVIQLNYDPETLSIEDNALTVIGGGSSVSQAYLNGVLLDSEATSINAKIYWYGTEEEYNALDSEAKNDPNTLFLVESSEGRPISWTKSYYELEDKPQINGVTLSGDKSLSSFGIQPTLTGTNPISVAGNQVSLRYNENQFFIGADNKLSFNDKDPSFDASHIITFRTGFVGILGGMECTKFNNGLYVGNLKFMNEAQIPTGDITIGAAFGDNGNTFNGYCIGFDETNHVPITFEVVDGELHMYNNNVIPSRRYITVPFTFVL